MPVASIGSGDLAKVWEIKTLGRPRDSEARALLENIAKQVQPIMRQRKWRVALLSEFYPKNPCLLGLNVGAGIEVRIRLRKPGRETEFLPYEDLVGTMLHELTHNVHGPHDAKFYKLLDEITTECEDLMAKGISGSGQGFDAPGTRLGGLQHNPPQSNLRNAALAAAEKRARTSSVMPGGARRLGGDCMIMHSLTPVQAAAMAAERRLRDDLWCAAPDTVGDDALQKANEKENTSAVNMGSLPLKSRVPSLANVEPLKSRNRVSVVDNVEPLHSKSNSKVSTAVTVETLQSRSRVSAVVDVDEWQHMNAVSDTTNKKLKVLGSPTVSSQPDAAPWECSICTLLNPPLAMICAACSTIRSVKNPTGWNCKFCTLENDKDLEKCAACSEWRYSYGPPVGVAMQHSTT